MGRGCVRRMLSRLAAHEERHEGRTAGCEGPGSSGSAFGDYGARYRHRHSHRHRHRDNLQSMKLPVDSAVVGYPAAAAGVPAELPKPASPKRRYHRRHHSPPAEPSRLHIHHHIYCEAGAPIQDADEALRRGSSRRHGRRCTEHVHFHYASDSAQPVQGVPVPEEAQAAAQTTRLHSI